MTLPSQNTPGPDHAIPDYETVSEKAVEPKTVAGVVGAGGGFAVSEFINYLIDVVWFGGPDLLPTVPLPVSGFVGFVVTAGGAFAASYYARHVNRA